MAQQFMAGISGNVHYNQQLYLLAVHIHSLYRVFKFFVSSYNFIIFAEKGEKECVHLRFWSVQWVGAVPDILCAVEHPESQACQKVSGGEVASHRPNGKACTL